MWGGGDGETLVRGGRQKLGQTNRSWEEKGGDLRGFHSSRISIREMGKGGGRKRRPYS